MIMLFELIISALVYANELPNNCIHFVAMQILDSNDIRLYFSSLKSKHGMMVGRYPYSFFFFKLTQFAYLSDWHFYNPLIDNYLAILDEFILKRHMLSDIYKEGKILER